MNDTTFTAYLLDQHRAADLAREHQLLAAQRERGASVESSHRRTLGARLRAATHRAPAVGAVATR